VAGLVLVTAATSEPVTITQAKAHLRVTHTNDDTLITTLITVARDQLENRYGRGFVTQTWRLELDAFPTDGVIELPKRPVASVTSVTAYLANATTSVVSSGDYVVDLSSTTPRVVLEADASWPSGELLVANGVRVVFVSGVAAASVPPRFYQALLIHIATLYENREDVIAGVTVEPLGLVDDLMRYDWAALVQ
jgi:uncharacterized phiE125 gp8 family phage protein